MPPPCAGGRHHDVSDCKREDVAVARWADSTIPVIRFQNNQEL